MKQFSRMLRNLIFVVVVATSTVVKADSDSLYSRPFLNSVFYGTLVGFIVGLVMYHGELGTYRCTSYGFYGGIALGLYISNKDDTPRFDNEPVTFENRPTLSFSFRY